MRKERTQKGRLSQKIQRHWLRSASASPSTGPVTAPMAHLLRVRNKALL